MRIFIPYEQDKTFSFAIAIILSIFSYGSSSVFSNGNPDTFSRARETKGNFPTRRGVDIIVQKDNRKSRDSVQKEPKIESRKSPFSPPKPVNFYSVRPSKNDAQRSFSYDPSSNRIESYPSRRMDTVVEVAQLNNMHKRNSKGDNHRTPENKMVSNSHAWTKTNGPRQSRNQTVANGNNDDIVLTTRNKSRDFRTHKNNINEDRNVQISLGRAVNRRERRYQNKKNMVLWDRQLLFNQNLSSNGAAVLSRLIGDTSPQEIDIYAGPVHAKPRPATAGSQEPAPDATVGLLTSHPHGTPKKHIFCYYGTSANSRLSVGKFWPENVDPFLCTHLIFAFADITADGTDIKPNNWNDLGENGLYTRTLRLKEKNPDLKILLAVGGWKIGSKPFLPVIESAATWMTWISNVIVYLRRFKFDGLDMDWEFPGWRGSGPEDRHKFTWFMKDLHEAFAEEAASTGRPRLLLTLATAASAFYVEKAYEPTEIHKYIDYMLLMTYNFHGSGWEKQTGHHTPLLPHPLDPEGEQRELYVLWAINYWLNFGVPRSKMVMGMASYGLGWKLTDSTQTGIRAPADGGNMKGKYTEESGILSHFEVCEHVIRDGWKVEWIDEQKVPYAYGDGEWVGFDSPDSFYIKAVTILQEGLAGAFVWSVEMDDFNGHCGGPKYPLIRTVYEVFTEHPLALSAPSSSPARLQVSDPAAGHRHGQGEHHPPSAAVAAHTQHGSQDHTMSHGTTSHHSPTLHHTTVGQQNSNPKYDYYHYEFDPDVDGHLSKPWQTKTDYDYEYYDWWDKHGETAPASAAASKHEDYYEYHDKDYHNDYHQSKTIEGVDCNSLGLGIHHAPHSCHHFVLCMPVSAHELGSSLMECPGGTLYDDSLKVCNHEHLVDCAR